METRTQYLQNYQQAQSSVELDGDSKPFEVQNYDYIKQPTFD